MLDQYRKEKDSLGEVYVPKDAYYGAQTQRALQNFSISNLTLPSSIISALGHIKEACAYVNGQQGLLAPEHAKAIMQAAELVATNHYDNHFPIDIFQTGSGTSSNMNANEVIAYVASKNTNIKIHPNDEVNCSQSSNDVFPSAIKIAATTSIKQKLLPAIIYLISHIEERIQVYGNVVKTGRTHLMDAVPLTIAQEFSAWIAQLKQIYQTIEINMERLRELPLGGTAIGTGLNAPENFGKMVTNRLTEKTGLRFEPMENRFAGIASQDALVSMSGQIKVLATILYKISNDLRWMNSGPYAGLAEIYLPVLQPGSSIMPGKVNPVIPEAILMATVQVMAYDVAITQAGSAGNFQLNTMLPLIGYNLTQSIRLLANSCRELADKVIKDLVINKEHIKHELEKNPILITALNRQIGYEKGAEIVKRAYEEKRSVLEIAQEVTGLDRQQLEKILDPLHLTKGGII